MQKDLFLKKLFVYVTMDNHPKVMSLTTVLLKPALLKKRHWSRCSPVNFLKFLRKRTPLGDFFYVFWYLQENVGLRKKKEILREVNFYFEIIDCFSYF